MSYMAHSVLYILRCVIHNADWQCTSASIHISTTSFCASCNKPILHEITQLELMQTCGMQEGEGFHG